MRIANCIQEPKLPTKSTFLVARFFCAKFQLHEVDITEYLHYLLKDPLLEYKLSFLKARKWKKTYQDKGMDLQRLDFYPDEPDWARISMLCNGTGFSRCYLFVYLMLLDRGFLVLMTDGKGTTFGIVRELSPLELFCSIYLNEDTGGRNELTRVVQT